MYARAGTTLIDLIAAAGLFSLLAGLAVLHLPGLSDPIRLRGAAHELAATLRLARARALAHGVRVRVSVAGSPPVATVFEGSTPVGSWHLPRVAIVSLPAGGSLTFTPFGTAPNATITFGAGTRLRSVIVNQRGRVRVG